MKRSATSVGPPSHGLPIRLAMETEQPEQPAPSIQITVGRDASPASAVSSLLTTVVLRPSAAAELMHYLRNVRLVIFMKTPNVKRVGSLRHVGYSFGISKIFKQSLTHYTNIASLLIIFFT